MAQSDPTDHALAAIASILDQAEAHRAPEEPPANDTLPAAERATADGYCKVGPGPMAAIRFKWTVRRADDENYYVDETMGETSTPVVSGPMSANAAMQFVDDRESEARRSFEALRNEMNGRSAAANFARNDGKF